MSDVWGPWSAAAEPAPMAQDAAPSQYPCSSCGATLSYAPGETVLHCAFCGSDTPIPRLDAEALRAAVREQDYLAALAREESGGEIEETRTVACDACGAQVEFDPANHATECPFCATPLVADPSPDRHIRPQALLPFAITRDAARAVIGEWLAGLWFAPNGLRRYARTDSRLTGVYTPYWTFDARTETAYAGQRGDVYVVQTSGPDGKPRQSTRVRWTPRSGRLRRAFDDVLVLGATSLPREDTDALAPWDLSALEPYNRDYLAGFRAESYTVPLRDGYAGARGIMDARIQRDVRGAIGGDQQRVERIDTRVSDVTFKHVLLPVWLGAYRYRNRVYRIVINGRTGAVRGGRPYSAWKIAFAVVAALALAGLIAVAVQQSGGLR